MKSFFKVLLNIFTFGTPLFLEILSKSRKFNKLINDQLTVKVDLAKSCVSIALNDKTKSVLNLGVDGFTVDGDDNIICHVHWEPKE